MTNSSFRGRTQVEHTRHRSIGNFLVNLVSGLIAYCHQAKKPSLNLTNHQMQALSNPTVIPN